MLWGENESQFLFSQKLLLKIEICNNKTMF